MMVQNILKKEEALNKKKLALTLILDWINDLVSKLITMAEMNKIIEFSEEDYYEIERKTKEQLGILVRTLKEKVIIPKTRKKETIHRLKKIQAKCPQTHPARGYWLELSGLISSLEKSLKK